MTARRIPNRARAFYCQDPEDNMRLMAICLAAACLLPAVASAQDSSSALRYCQALAQKYTTYVGTSEFSPSQPADRRTDPEARLALSRCHQGDARTAIPILENRLRNAKVELPARP
jgi:hypothetical protein